MVNLAAQEKFTISGHIKDSSSGEMLIGVNIYIRSLKTGTSTNNYGFYSLTLPLGEYMVEYSYMGYSTIKKETDLNKNIKQDIELEVTVTEGEEIVIIGEKADANIKSARMGITELRPLSIKPMPVIFGEQDVLKTIQLLPGVKSVTEAGSGFSVRGGKTDQNLILLDEATVYNASHLGGFFSVFNSDAIKNLKLIKGAFPSSYGGRLSSVLEMTMNDGNKKRFTGAGGVGLIFSRFTFQGPIFKDKASFLLSGRRSYFDLFMNLSKDKDVRDSKLYFYDLNMKTNFDLGENDRIFISGYFGRDVIGFKDIFGLDWGNSTATIRWNHIFSEKLFLNSTFLYSDFDYKIGVKDNSTEVDISSSINDFSLKEDFQYFKDYRNTISFGLHAVYHRYLPGQIALEDERTSFYYKVKNKYAFETAAYVSNEHTVSDIIKLEYGLRFSLFNVMGPGDVHTFDNNGKLISTETFGKGKAIKKYSALEPRFSSSFYIGQSSSIKASYGRISQYVHLLSTSVSSSPMDIWHPSTNNVKPEMADQVSLGLFKNLNNNTIETSVEVYYKGMKNQIEYKNNADIMFNEYVEGELVFGKGRAYGTEFYLNKKSGKLNGWLSYTLSRTERIFDKINDGKAFPARYDRTHEFSIVGIYKPSSKWTFSAVWNYHTGDAVTFPSGKYYVDNRVVNLYTGRNGYRMPAYHRLDLGVTKRIKKKGRFEMDMNLTIYNAYGRKNAYSIYFRESETNPGNTEAVRVALFSFFPTMTMNFKF